jgi:hypothetical protein
MNLHFFSENITLPKAHCCGAWKCHRTTKKCVNGKKRKKEKEIESYFEA